MNQARKWWPGLVLVAILWGLAIWHSTEAVERDMVARAEDALKDSLLTGMQLGAAGRDVTMAAAAFSEEGRKSAVQFVETEPGIRLVIDRTKLVPEASPFVWGAKRNVTGISLSGAVPLPAIRAKVLEAARNAASGGEVSDKMEFGRGAPQRWDAAALVLIEQLGKLKDGEVQLNGTQVSITGMARDIGGREVIALGLRHLPEGFTIASMRVDAPPFVFRATKDPVASTVVLSGNAPDANARAALVAEAGRKIYGERIVDELKLSPGAPANFAQAASAALSHLARLSTGMLTMSDRQIALSGDALYEAAAAQIRNTLPANLPQGYQAKAEISVRPQAAQVDITICQQIYTDTLTKNRIRFESGSANINADSTALLDRLVEIAQRCPSAKIDIEGHTDSDGDADANLKLSQARARAVADFLTKAGLPNDRISSNGFGPTRPIASNETPEGKAINRRIEFHLK